MILPTRAEIFKLAQNRALLNAVFSERWECRYQHFDAIAQELKKWGRIYYSAPINERKVYVALTG
ncbi:hypothetical protein ABHN98_03760 [Pseudomonas syringae]